jgi:hypothetical protein
VAKIGVFRFRLRSRKAHGPEAVRTNRRVGGWRIGLVYLWHSIGSPRPNQALKFDANNGVPRANLFLATAGCGSRLRPS